MYDDKQPWLGGDVMEETGKDTFWANLGNGILSGFGQVVESRERTRSAAILSDSLSRSLVRVVFAIGLAYAGARVVGALFGKIFK